MDEKKLCWGSLGVGVVLLLLFLLDLALKIPFGEGVSRTVDIIVVIAAALLTYLSWNAVKDLR